MKTKYRVLIEEITDEEVTQRKEVTVRVNEDDKDINLSLGIAVAGAVAGMCVYCEPTLEVVLGWVLWCANELPACMKALGDLNQIPEVAFDKDVIVLVKPGIVPKGEDWLYATEATQKIWDEVKSLTRARASAKENS